MIHGWHFFGDRLRDGSPVPPDGEWAPRITPTVICERGYHGSPTPLDALPYAAGSNLAYCEFRGIGDGEWHNDKFVAEERRILVRMDATEMLRYFARMQALSVIDRWDAPDVMLDYLMTGDEALRAAAEAAARAAAEAGWGARAAWATWDAAQAAVAAARHAARAVWAAQDAARDAARAAAHIARADFNALVYECFESVVTPDGKRREDVC